MASRYLAAVAVVWMAAITMIVHSQDIRLSYIVEAFNGILFRLNFTSTMLVEFNACLCTNSTQHCDLYYPLNGVVSRIETTQFSSGSADLDRYSNTYMCSQINDNNNHIRCSRLAITTCPSASNCESFQVHGDNNVCQMGSANIAWNPRQYISLRYIGNITATVTLGSCYGCNSTLAQTSTSLRTSFPTTVRTTEFIDVARTSREQGVESSTSITQTQKAITRTALNPVNATIPGNEDDDDPTVIIVVVGVVVAVIVILALVIIIICFMRRKRLTSKSKEQRVFPDKTAKTSKESVSGVDSHVYEQADDEITFEKTIGGNTNDSSTPHTFSSFSSASGNDQNKTDNVRVSSSHVYDEIKDEDETPASTNEFPLQTALSSLANSNPNRARDESSTKITPTHVGFYSNTYDHPTHGNDTPDTYTRLYAPNKDSSATGAKPVLNKGKAKGHGRNTRHYVNDYDRMYTGKGSPYDEHTYKVLMGVRQDHKKGRNRDALPDIGTGSGGNPAYAVSGDYITPIDYPYSDTANLSLTNSNNSNHASEGYITPVDYPYYGIAKS